jgi:hypothetical protein
MQAASQNASIQMLEEAVLAWLRTASTRARAALLANGPNGTPFTAYGP